MPYTLAKFFLWGLLMALAGGIVGWLLRSLKARTDLARSRRTTVDESEVERLRGRLANLEPVVAERDRLRMELADVRGSSAGALGFSSAVATSIIPPDDALAVLADDAPRSAAAEAASGAAATETEATTAAEVAVVVPPVALDLASAAATLGKKIVVDDLTTIEGIGPKIAGLCGGIGVTTWSQLAATDVDALQSMLDEAGSRFQMHKPASWPLQAELLAAGRWSEFKELTASLSGGR